MTKNEIITILKFFTIGVIILSLISYLIDTGVRNSDNAQTGKVNYVFKHKIDPDIMVFGSSVGEVGIDVGEISKNTGLSAYNCSIDGTCYIQYKALIDEFMTYSKKCKYVLFVEAYFSLNNYNALHAFDRYISRIDNKNIYNSFYNIQPDLVAKSKYVPFYKYIATTKVYYKNSFIGWKNYIEKKSIPDSLMGFTPVHQTWQKMADDNISNIKNINVNIDSNVVQEYIKTIKSLNSQGKKVIIIIPPIFIEEQIKITDITPLINTLKQVSEKTGANFLNFSNIAVSNDRKYFYNGHHLNYLGAKEFSHNLSDSLNVIIKR